MRSGIKLGSRYSGYEEVCRQALHLHTLHDHELLSRFTLHIHLGSAATPDERASCMLRCICSLPVTAALLRTMLLVLGRHAAKSNPCFHTHTGKAPQQCTVISLTHPHVANDRMRAVPLAAGDHHEDAEGPWGSASSGGAWSEGAGRGSR